MDETSTPLKAYGRPAARVVAAALAAPILILVWWVGQGCVDDPCEIGRGAEWRGLILVAIFGTAALVLASPNYRPLRLAVWLSTAIPTALQQWNDPPQPEGFPVVSQAPGIAAVAASLVASFLPVLFLTLCLDWWVVGRSRRASN